METTTPFSCWPAESDYALLDSGHGRKLERFGSIVLDRPCSQAVWRPLHPERWSMATASFDRQDGMRWQGRDHLPESWEVHLAGLQMRLAATDFGHLGVFPETLPLWVWLRTHLAPGTRFLNLFAYSGGASLAAAQAGAEVCHVDASRGMVVWARDNAARNGLEHAPIRWIVDDAQVFLRREARRGRRYHAVLLDPPSFGRGRRGELYKIERDVQRTVDLIAEVLAPDPAFVILTSHTPGFTPQVLQNLLTQSFGTPTTAGGEMLIHATDTLPLPAGTWAWAIFSPPPAAALPNAP